MLQAVPGQEALMFSEHIKIYTKDHCEVSCSSEPQGGASRNNFSSSQTFHYRLNLHLRLGAVTPAFAISTLTAPSAHEWTFVSHLQQLCRDVSMGAGMLEVYPWCLVWK